MEDFSHVVDHLNLCGRKLLILGDFHLHVDVNSSEDAPAFLDVLDASNLIQHVKQATHIHSHILYLVITRPTMLQVNSF